MSVNDMYFQFASNLAIYKTCFVLFTKNKKQGKLKKMLVGKSMVSNVTFLAT